MGERECLHERCLRHCHYHLHRHDEMIGMPSNHLKVKFVGIKSHLNAVGVNTAQLELVLLIVDNCKKGLEYENYNAVSPPYTGNFMPPKPDLSYTGLDEFAVKPVVENKSIEEETKEVRKNTDALIIEE
nr:hypothetical protein [Tanacetum cinerariifolium]